MMKIKSTLPIFVLSSTAMLSACSMQPGKHTLLEEARSNYAVAQSSVDVNKFASVELQQAGDALEKTNDAQIKRENTTDIDQLAYLVTQRVAIAKIIEAKQNIENNSATRKIIRFEMTSAEVNDTNKPVESVKESASLSEPELNAVNDISEHTMENLVTLNMKNDLAHQDT